MTKLATEEINQAMGRRLLAVREAAQLSQAYFAVALDLSPRAYANYERGEREAPVALLRNLLRVYAVDPAWLLDGPGDLPVRRTLKGEQSDQKRAKRNIALCQEILETHGISPASLLQSGRGGTTPRR
jgi:transcriptional regulator with XRE-family HTH domain